ncbi:hypothetical protein QE364_003985 [Nocardioides zeae]|uniref:Uncharacterized protein n=1 Tax=Nocardioides zeae TaxID=1457234 RepID=A0ACC6INS0_9ACTN|nr:hypothetical protein [Nocardioides zeae]MDR6173385.1 hypothetical protein [Nocardioides zeae]MDR6212250.1 hypothetical protein [Nocardioides zeae]
MSPDSVAGRPHRDGGSPLPLLHGALADLVGLPTWDARIGVGSFLQVEIGPPAPRAPGDRRNHGTCHLWFYGCGTRRGSAR